MLSRLPDEVLLDIIGRLSAFDLCRAAASSKMLYCLCNHEELWRSAVLTEQQQGFVFRDSWKQSYILRSRPHAPCKSSSVQCRGVYSDLLYQPWLCATTSLQPSWLRTQTLERRSGLSPVSFRETYELPGQPVIISDGAAAWPAKDRWTRSYLLKAFHTKQVVVGEMNMTLQTYLSYLDTMRDEMPLYLFDKGFADKAPSLRRDIEVPACFEDDLFSVLGTDRPDHSWLIWGPARSGSTFHKDPNGTSAWNAVTSGSKKWILYPPHILPPGVHASPDGADVVSPVSLVEWFLKFYDQTHQGHSRPVEGIVRAGEVLFVPQGWWHLAMNLEETVAVTQNFVSRINLQTVLHLLRSRRSDLLSGCMLKDRGTLHDRFLSALQQQHPQLVDQVSSETKALPEAFECQQSKPGTFSFDFAL